jgi:hypothetical protein
MNLAVPACCGTLTVEDVDNADVDKLSNDILFGFSVFFWASKKCPVEVVERILDKTKLDVNIGTNVRAY